MAKWKLSQEQVDEIVKIYTTTNVNLTNLAKLCNVHIETAKKYLSENNISIEKRSGGWIKYPYNKQFFLNKNKKTAYFFGFMLGDGNIQPGKNFNINLQERDFCVLKQFCDWTNRDYKSIKFKKSNYPNRQNTYSLAFSGKKLFENIDYSKWGLIPNKTYNPIIPDIDKSLLKSFFIGLIDADGSVTYNDNYGNTGKPNNISLTGNSKILDWFVDNIKFFGFNGKIKEYKRTPSKCYHTICVNIKKDIINLAKILEIDKCDFCLKRKWGTLQETLKTKNYQINNRLKITEKEALEIIEIYKVQNLSLSKIGKIYNIVPEVISKILKGTYFSQTKCALDYKQPETEIVSIKRYYPGTIKYVGRKKFTEEQCEEIRNLYKNEQIGPSKLSRIYKTARNVIYDILNYTGGYKKAA